jgi:hypothetical protein
MNFSKFPADSPSGTPVSDPASFQSITDEPGRRPALQFDSAANLFAYEN